MAYADRKSLEGFKGGGSEQFLWATEHPVELIFLQPELVVIVNLRAEIREHANTGDRVCTLSPVSVLIYKTAAHRV